MYDSWTGHGLYLARTCHTTTQAARAAGEAQHSHACLGRLLRLLLLHLNLLLNLTLASAEVVLEHLR